MITNGAAHVRMIVHDMENAVPVWRIIVIIMRECLDASFQKRRKQPMTAVLRHWPGIMELFKRITEKQLFVYEQVAKQMILSI